MRKTSKGSRGRGVAAPVAAGRRSGPAKARPGAGKAPAEGARKGVGKMPSTRPQPTRMARDAKPKTGVKGPKGAASSAAGHSRGRPAAVAAVQKPALRPTPRAPQIEPPVPPPVAVRMETVDPERAGQRIDNFLVTRLKGVPKSAVYRVLRTGQVRINGKRAKPETKLEAGDIVRIPPLRVDEVGTPVAPSDSLRDSLAERIVFEDGEFLLLDKPTGLAAHGGSGISLGAIEAMRAIRPTQSIELVHRLDRDTSGLLLLAKKHSALRRLQALIRENRMQKRYFALLAGSPKRDRFEVDAALRKNQLRGGERMVEVDEDEGKASLSRFKVIERYATATLVEVEIVTGRTHQIRVHAQHIGHPVAGDPKYGDEAFNKSMKAVGLKRLFLHAHSLRFPWGEAGDERQFNAPMGPDLRGVLEKLAR
jgi:23S rRNA pseudouridine955/2504/2580 synthase